MVWGMEKDTFKSMQAFSPCEIPLTAQARGRSSTEMRGILQHQTEWLWKDQTHTRISISLWMHI